MVSQPLSLLLIAACLVFISCATVPRGEDLIPSGPGARAPGESTGDAGTGGVIEEGEADSAGAGAEAGGSATAAETALPGTLKVSASPAEPEIGDEVTIVIDTARYNSATYDFGDGRERVPKHVYETFGVKTVVVTATENDMAVSTEFAFPVFGKTVLNLPKNEVEHDASGKPVIDGELEPSGDFDTTVVYEEGREVLKTSGLEASAIPVPFVGQRTFTASLFDKGFHVADVGEVTIVGLNSAPGKPVLQGPQLISATVGEEVSFTVSSVDPNNDPVRYQIKFAPEGAVFDETSGAFSWTPTRAQRGAYLLSVTAYDIPYGLASQFTQRAIVVQ